MDIQTQTNEHYQMEILDLLNTFEFGCNHQSLNLNENMSIAKALTDRHTELSTEDIQKVLVSVSNLYRRMLDLYISNPKEYVQQMLKVHTLLAMCSLNPEVPNHLGNNIKEIYFKSITRSILTKIQSNETLTEEEIVEYFGMKNEIDAEDILFNTYVYLKNNFESLEDQDLNNLQTLQEIFNYYQEYQNTI